MADYVGLIASIITIIGVVSFATLYLQAILYSNFDIQNVAPEISSLIPILDSMGDYATANPNSTTVQILKTLLQRCLDDLQVLDAKLTMGRSGRMGRWRLRLQWYKLRNEFSQHLGELERLKSSISLVMDLDLASSYKFATMSTQNEESLEMLRSSFLNRQ